MVLIKKVLIRFKVEKRLSHSAIDMGVVQIMSTNLLVSENVVVKLLSDMNTKIDKISSTEHILSFS